MERVIKRRVINDILVDRTDFEYWWGVIPWVGI